MPQYTLFKPTLIREGARIVSYPNHKGESLEGVIIGLHPDNPSELHVNYSDRGRTVLKPNGKLLSLGIDTNLDINLIEV